MSDMLIDTEFIFLAPSAEPYRFHTDSVGGAFFVSLSCRYE